MLRAVWRHCTKGAFWAVAAVAAVSTVAARRFFIVGDDEIEVW